MGWRAGFEGEWGVLRFDEGGDLWGVSKLFFNEVECFIIKLSCFLARLLFHCIKIAPANSVYCKIKIVLSTDAVTTNKTFPHCQ